MDDLIAKFAPPRLQTDPRFHAVLACLLGGYHWTKPYCVKVIITGEGEFVGLRPGGEMDCFGPVSDLTRNLRQLVDQMGLTKTERYRLAGLISRNIVVEAGEFNAFAVLGLAPPDPRVN